MSWHKITLPRILNALDPKVLEIGKLGIEIWEKENKPAGFAMFHALRNSYGQLDDKFLVYLTPVASELCTEIAERYPLEPCDVPARNEPGIAYVFGDPLMMGALKEEFEPEPGTIEWDWAEQKRQEYIRSHELYREQERINQEQIAQLKALQEQEAQAKALQDQEAEADQAEDAKADSAQA